MPRTTEVLVKGVIDADCEISLIPFIRAANIVVSRVATCAASKGVTLSAEELREIETWLAAHYYAQRDMQYTSKRTQSASASFQGQTGMGLDSTLFGQTAKTLDPSGCLASLTAGARAGLYWLGRNPSAQTPYSDRR